MIAAESVWIAGSVLSLLGMGILGCCCGGSQQQQQQVVVDEDEGPKRVCPDCGIENPEEANYCGDCGRQFEKENA